MAVANERLLIGTDREVACSIARRAIYKMYLRSAMAPFARPGKFCIAEMKKGLRPGNIKDTLQFDDRIAPAWLPLWDKYRTALWRRGLVASLSTTEPSYLYLIVRKSA